MQFILLLFIFIVLAEGRNSCNTTQVKDCKIITDDKPYPAILGGYAAKMSEFPYAVRLYTKKIGLISSCTGGAIRRRLVITAAHCVNEYSASIVVTGDSNQDDYMNGRNLYKYARYRVIDVFVHPKYDGESLMHDVAIVKTGREMMHPGHGYINLSYEKLVEPVKSKIYGWGRTEVLTKNNQLYGKVLKSQNCTLSVSSSPYEFICLMEKGISHGDSGGGLIVNETLFGVASFYQRGLGSEPDRYFYTAFWEEKKFLKECIDQNRSNYNESFYHIIWVFLFYQLILTILELQ